MAEEKKGYAADRAGLQDAVVRLETALAARLEGEKEGSDAQVAALEQDLADLRAEFEALRAENRRLNGDLIDARADHAALEEVADAVGGRLDTTIEQIRTMIEG
ncbi:MAG: DUF4164 family protein [Alphaproteobacteria bacterium]|jgi:chromosome segregation ATPase|nr:DUF4164 family protein [Alphaproteobacteria bacterium]